MGLLNAFGVKDGEGLYHEETIYSLALVYNIIHNRVAEYLKPFDLSPGKFNVLVAIKHHGGDQGIPQCDIGKHLIVTPSNMTKLIDKLEREGHVKRFAHSSDRRIKITKVTDKGHRLIDKVWDGYKDILNNLSRALSREEQKRMSHMSVKWLDALLHNDSKD